MSDDDEKVELTQRQSDVLILETIAQFAELTGEAHGDAVILIRAIARRLAEGYDD